MVVVGTIVNDMPELPEVETVKRTLENFVLNEKIKSVEVFRDKTIQGDVLTFKKSLTNETIIGFERIGKFIIFHLSNNKVIISHLRMEGKFYKKDESCPNEKHDLVVFHFFDNTKLVYNDTRKFGIIKISSKLNYKNEEPLSKVGPDPFMIKDSDLLKEAFKNKTIPIKTALLDQSIMSGLGNIYVDEVLYECGIHPEIPAKYISKKQLDNILENSKSILKNAIDSGGTTIKSYHPQEGISGKFQVSLKVYGKKGKECPKCGTQFIKTFVNGRGTTFCPHCQINQYKKKVYGLTGPIGSGKTTISNSIAKYNFKVLNCDEIVHDLYKDKNIQKEIKAFIPNIVIINNEIDRSELKNIILNNQNLKEKLENFVFKKVEIIIKKEIKNSKNNILIEAPLLFESNIDKLCDEIIYIDVPISRQKENLTIRGSDVDSSIKLNKSFNSKKAIKKATIIIRNDKDIAHLEKQIQSIFCK